MPCNWARLAAAYEASNLRAAAVILADFQPYPAGSLARLWAESINKQE
jgi:hypothetical protein